MVRKLTQNFCFVHYTALIYSNTFPPFPAPFPYLKILATPLPYVRFWQNFYLIFELTVKKKKCNYS